MITWNNLDTLTSYQELEKAACVNLAEVMTGEKGAERVKKYSVPMAEGLVYHYAAKQVDDTVLDALKKLADEAQLAEKFKALYNGEVINTGEKRLVLHHMTRGQLGDAVIADGVDKSTFYKQSRSVSQNLPTRFTMGTSRMLQEKSLLRLFRSVSAAATLAREPCIWHWKTGQRRTALSRWRQSSSAM